MAAPGVRAPVLPGREGFSCLGTLVVCRSGWGTKCTESDTKQCSLLHPIRQIKHFKAQKGPSPIVCLMCPSRFGHQGILPGFTVSDELLSPGDTEPCQCWHARSQGLGAPAAPPASPPAARAQGSTSYPAGLVSATARSTGIRSLR